MDEEREEFTLPGMAHRMLAGGLEGTDVWLRTMEPAAETPPHYHECKDVAPHTALAAFSIRCFSCSVGRGGTSLRRR